MAETTSSLNSFRLMAYNNPRDTDRIYPSCRRWYKVGEPEHQFEYFNHFLQRDIPMSMSMDAIVEDPDDAARNGGKKLRRSGAWVVRRRTLAEEAEEGHLDYSGVYRQRARGRTDYNINQQRFGYISLEEVRSATVSYKHVHLFPALH